MNCKANVLLRSRGRNRFARGRNNVVNVQRPSMGPPRRPAPRRNSTAQSTNSSNIIWKNPSCQTANTTMLRSSSSRSHSTSYSVEMESRVIVAICEGRGEATCEVGIAAIDVSRPLLILSQISDSQSYVNTLTKINILNPHEILVPLTFVENFALNRLMRKIKEQFKETKITAVSRSTFNKTTGTQYIKELCAPQWNSVQLILQHKFYALSAAAALLNYTESILYVVYAKESIKVEYHESEGFTLIDVATADRLELVASLSQRANKKYSSLLGIMNYCVTKIGGRILRASILQPPCCVSDIEARLECVTELKRDPSMLASIQSILSKLTNIDQLLSLATFLPEQAQDYSERQLNYMLMLNTTLESMTPLHDALEGAKQPFFIELRSTLSSEPLGSLKELVRTVIHSDAHPAKGQQGIVQRCFAIKSGVNSLLDIIRKSYSERAEEMSEYVKNLGEQYQLALTLGNNNKKGYHIVLKLDKVQKRMFKKSDLPSEFIQVERLANTVTMKTQEVINFSAIIYDILLEILKLSNIMIYNILVEVRGHIGLFYKLCDDIAKLDMFQSLAHACSGINYTRPMFAEYLDVLNSRHPLLDYLCSTEPTSNSFSASDYFNMHIITGPNGSGKSIFIRQILLLQVMAQVGCFVPAESATFRVCDRILARIYFDGNMNYGASTFALEMKEIEYFRAVMSKNTLIIIDELCRSTAEEEGTATAMAICEDLAKSSAFVFFTTHFAYLTKIQDLYLNIDTWQLETLAESNDDGDVTLHFTFNVVSGVTSLKKYGLFMAKASWPDHVWKIADEFFKQNKQTSLVGDYWDIIAGETEGIKIEDRLKYALESDLKLLKLKGQLNVENLNERCLQYTESMNAIGFHIDLAHINRNLTGDGSNFVDVEPQNLNFSSGKSSGYENTANIVNAPNRQIVMADVHRNFDASVDQNNWVFTPLENDASLTQCTDVALQFNESIRKDPDFDRTYIVPDVVYSDAGSENSVRQSNDNDLVFQTNANNFIEYSQNSFREPVSDFDVSDQSKLSRQFSENFNATVNRYGYGSNANECRTDVSQMNEADISMLISQKFKDCMENYHESNRAGSDVSLNINYEHVQESIRPFNVTSWATRSKSSDGDFQVDAPTLKTHTSNSLSSVNEYQFSLPLQMNDRKTSTPLVSYSETNHNQSKVLNFNSFEMNKKSTQVQNSVTKKSSDSSESIVWKLKHESSQNVTSGNEPVENDVKNSCGVIGSMNAGNDRDVTAAIDDLHDCSEYLTDAEDWDDISEDILPIISQVNASIEKAAIEDLQNCSEYFTDAEDWYTPNDDVSNQKEKDVMDNNEQTKNAKVLIHSVYAFDKNNKLMNQFDNYDNTYKMKVNSNENVISNVPSRKQIEATRPEMTTDITTKISHQENRKLSEKVVDSQRKNLSSQIVSDWQKDNETDEFSATNTIEHTATVTKNRNPMKLNSRTGQIPKENAGFETNVDINLADRNVSLGAKTCDENKITATKKLEKCKSLISRKNDGVTNPLHNLSSHTSTNVNVSGLNFEINSGSSQRNVSSLTNPQTAHHEFIKTNASNNTSTNVNVSGDASALIKLEVIGNSTKRQNQLNVLSKKSTMKPQLMQNNALTNTSINVNVSRDINALSKRLKLEAAESGKNLNEITLRKANLTNSQTPHNDFPKTIASNNTSTNVNVSSEATASTKFEAIGKSTKRQNQRNVSTMKPQLMQNNASTNTSINVNISSDTNTLLKRLKLETAEFVKIQITPSKADLTNSLTPHNNFPKTNASTNTSRKVNVSSDASTSKISKTLNIETLNSSTDKSANTNEIDEVIQIESNVIDQNENQKQEFISDRRVSANSQLNTQKNDGFNEAYDKINTPKRSELELNESKNCNTRELLSHNIINEEESIIEGSQEERKVNTRCFKRFGLTRQVKRVKAPPVNLKHDSFFENSDNVSFSLDEATYSDVFESAVETTTKIDSKNTSSEMFQTPEGEAPYVNKPADKTRQRNTKFKRRVMKFKPPKMLTKRQIEQDFYEQDKKMLENYDPDKVSAYHAQIMNRPNVKQLQEQRHLAVIYKTDEGVVVMPTSPAKTKRKSKVVPLKKKASISDFDVQIFSDKNSEKFEGFLQSKKECEGAFAFEDGRSFDCIASTSRTGGMEFNFSAAKNETVFRNSETQRSANVSFTPDGYYKENKSTISNILKKYL